MCNRRRKFGIENLEARQMMAGDIAVDFSNGNLAITEALGHEGEANSIVVSRVADRVVNVLGGGVNQNFNVTGELSINLGAGNDTVLFNADLVGPNQGFNTQVHINVGSTNTADGNDIDVVEVIGAQVNGLLQIETGVGNDRVYVNSSTRVAGDGLAIFTGAGQDTIEVKDSWLSGMNIQTYASLTETDADRVDIVDINIDTAPGVSMTLGLGGGSDVFLLDDVHFSYINIDAGAGNDTGTMRTVYADEVMARLGNGSDKLNMYGVVVDDMTALGGDDGGVDTLTTRSGLGVNTNRFGTSTLSGWEWINGARLVRPRGDFIPLRL